MSSIDALPNELLGEIFSHLGGKQRVDLSLVNRRWCRILSTPTFTQDVKLCLNRRSDPIPIDMLHSSEREYQHISCSMTCDIFVQFELADLLEHCVQRWNVQSLEIHAYYDQLLLFLQVNWGLLVGLRALYIRVENITPFDSEIFDDDLVIKLKNLQILHWSYAASQSADQILSFVTPQLRRLEVCHDYTPQGCIVHPRMYIGPTLRHLQELYLCDLYCNPAEGFQLDLPNVRKLTLKSIAGSLVILNASCLTKLIVDFCSFKALTLCDTNTLRHVELHLCRDCPNYMLDSIAIWDSTRFFETHANQITKLTLVSHVEDTPFEKFSILLDLLPKIESLHLHQFGLPNSMDQLGPLLKNILITNCTTQARALTFPAQTERVRVYRLKGPRGQISLFPTDVDHPRLDSADIPARWYHLTTRAIHSTPGLQYQATGDYPSIEFGDHNHLGFEFWRCLRGTLLSPLKKLVVVGESGARWSP